MGAPSGILLPEPSAGSKSPANATGTLISTAAFPERSLMPPSSSLQSCMVPKVHHNSFHSVEHRWICCSYECLCPNERCYPFCFFFNLPGRPLIHMCTTLRSYKYNILGNPCWMNQRRVWVKLTDPKTFEPKDERKYIKPNFVYRDLRAVSSLIYRILCNFGT